MIFVDRKKVASPKILTHPDGAGRKELAEAVAFYQKVRVEYAAALKQKTPPAKSKKSKRAAPKKPNYEFSSYKDKEVKKLLEELFHNKCAYCEFNYSAGITGDVEHYRPKGAITSDTGKPIWPGYYWLALDWENLLPSCSICNQKHTQLDLSIGSERTLGKLNWFPLADESRRAGPEGDVSKEDPLLLNPCVDDPQKHLEFVERDGHRALLHARTEKGTKTIHILGLNRSNLVLARQKKLADMDALMADIQRACERLGRTANVVDQADFIKEIKEKTGWLKSFMSEEHEFSALALQEVPKFLNRMAALTNSVGPNSSQPTTAKSG